VALSYDEIADILKIIDSSSCDELIVDTGDMKLVVRRNNAGGAHSVQDDAPAIASRAAEPVMPVSQPTNEWTPHCPVSKQAAIENAQTQLSYATIRSPLSGKTAFRHRGSAVEAGFGPLVYLYAPVPKWSV